MRQELPVDQPCECTGPGFCQRYQIHQTEYTQRLCANNCTEEFPCSEEKSRRYREKWARQVAGVKRMPTRASLPLLEKPANKKMTQKQSESARGLCVFLGNATGEIRECKTCNSKMQKHRVYTCAKHGECAIAKPFPGLACCKSCDDWQAQSDIPLPVGKPLWTRRLDHDSLAPEMPGLRFNPSMIEDGLDGGDGYVFACRDGRTNSGILIGRLDELLALSGDLRRLQIRHPLCVSGIEDPRLFYHRGHLHISFVGVIHKDGKATASMLYARLDEELDAAEVFALYYADSQPMEKNWGFFSHENVLFAVYLTTPHRILHIEGNTAVLAHETQTLLYWQGGEIRGGAAPVRVGDEYWHFFHDRTAGKIYRMGLLTFDAHPPFAVQRYIPAPVLSADLTTWQKRIWHCPVIFPGGAVRREDDWLIACGVHDAWSEVHCLSHADLEKQLVRIAPPHWWRWLGEPNEPGMFTHIHATDEYQVRRLDLHGRIVLDVGAHVGTFAYLARHRGAAGVDCYEPTPEAFVALVANTERLGGVRCHQVAIGDCFDTATLERHGEATSNRVLLGHRGDVVVNELDLVITRACKQSPSGRVALLKLDCEGCEWKALRAANRLDLVDAIVGEYHLDVPESLRPGTPDELRNLLVRAGFDVEVVEVSESLGNFFAVR